MTYCIISRFARFSRFSHRLELPGASAHSDPDPEGSGRREKREQREIMQYGMVGVQFQHFAFGKVLLATGVRTYRRPIEP